jgi:hypothetical protein
MLGQQSPTMLDRIAAAQPSVAPAAGQIAQET